MMIVKECELFVKARFPMTGIVRARFPMTRLTRAYSPMTRPPSTTLYPFPTRRTTPLEHTPQPTYPSYATYGLWLKKEKCVRAVCFKYYLLCSFIYFIW